MFKKKLLIICAVVMLVPAVSDAYVYELYHIAIRDFNGDGSVNGDDHIRYGFSIKNNDGTWANKTNFEITVDGQRWGDVNGGTPYYENWGMHDSTDASWTQTNYYKTHLPVMPSGFNTVGVRELNGDWSVSHTPNFSDYTGPASMPTYNGPDITTLNTQKVDGGWQFSWDGDYGSAENSYRFTLSDWNNGKDIGRKFDNTVTSLFISDELLTVDGVTWALQFQERFPNSDFSADNKNWLRSYSGAADFVPTPIPGAAWLFASGLFGLVAVRRKKMMN